MIVGAKPPVGTGLMWPSAIITICKYMIGSWWCVNRSILCPSVPSVKSKSQVYFCASYEYLTLRISHNTTWKSKQKICTNFDHYRTKEQKMIISLYANELGLSIRGSEILQKITLTRVSSHWLWLNSVESFCEKRDSSRVAIFLNVTRVESESQKSRLESSHWLESRYYWQ